MANVIKNFHFFFNFPLIKNNLFGVKLVSPGFLMFRPSSIQSYFKIGQFLSLGLRPRVYTFACNRQGHQIFCDPLFTFFLPDNPHEKVEVCAKEDGQRSQGQEAREAPEKLDWQLL